ncbi:nineteen complex-related protein 2-domain-containing protein [Xylariaceae sp. FL0255]|nr:nineteen complex-related protein 2-domain-containing protein [Xylariaceae sp. FL0255]
MSAFGGKRKARKITIQDEDEASPSIESLNPPPEDQEPALQPTFKSRKPHKQSSLRKSILLDNAAKQQDDGETTEDQDDGGAPIRSPVVRPSATAAAKAKKRQSTSSRLSFGPGEIVTADKDDHEDSMILGGSEVLATPVSTKRGASKNLPLGRLPLPRRSFGNEDDDRPRYSKEYLSELQSATPNTPQDLSKLHITGEDGEEDEMYLDPSELEGAMIVDTTTSSSALPLTINPTSTTAVLTESEIREKKDRRARLALQQKAHGGTSEDFISLSDNENEPRRAGDSYLTVLSRQSHTKDKNDTRLVREDEDLGEGYDDFVEDGGLSLGKKAEREARRRHRAEMASAIQAAEGGEDGHSNHNHNGFGGDDEDDSEAERLAAFEAAQTRAGMDGLAEERAAQQRKRMGMGRDGVVPIPPKITPLPDLSVLVEAFKARMAQKESELQRVKAKVEELKAERLEITKREPEVQRLLNEAGERYRALMMPGGAGEGVGGGGEGGEGGEEGDGGVIAAAARTLVDQIISGDVGTPGERGLESLGTTPVRQRTQMEL